MRILMVYPNTMRMLAPAPIGASLVAARLRRDGHEVRMVDSMFARDPAREASDAARAFRPDLIGYSIRNVDSQSPTSYVDPVPEITRVVSAVRSAWPTTTLVGGTAFTSFPRQWLDALGADYGIAGDDLDPISRFVTSLADGKPDLETPGLIYRTDGGVRANPFCIRGYADVHFDGFDLIDYRRYRRHLASFWDGAVITRTGCPFQCIFCDTFRTYGRDWIFRDPRRVAEEARALRSRGVRSIFLADAGFNRPLDDAKAILETLIEADLGLTLSSVFEPGEVDDEFARLYRRAGGRQALVFAMSLSEPVLDRLRKPFQLSDVYRGVETFRRAGVGPMLYLTLGGPGETASTASETLAGADRARSIYTILDYGYRVQPETELREIAVAEGAIAADDDCFRATFYTSPEVSRQTLIDSIKRYQSSHFWSGWGTVTWGAKYVWDKVRP